MFKKRLFERIKDIDKKNDAICSQDEYIVSIIYYINKLLFVRKGSCLINKNFGMDNLYSSTDNSVSFFIKNAQQEIQNIITKYEPRLKNVVVTHFDTSGVNEHIFKIKAKLVKNDDNIILDCTLSSDQRVTIRSLENK
jgi:type VI secretion system protein